MLWQGVHLRFSWDERKNRINRRKHRVSFETAALVFDDPCHISHLDREVEGELRWQTIGMVKGIHVLLVVHTSLESDDEEGENVRIISARKATPQERWVYAQGE
ncbi:MAG TPA: BrnT family toxin [Candidatus Limnocylindrales bacterium]|nr:BrnT family toxin [Candidatus Limnocylindrales bacterium]HZM09869.1 BrnT family toxin [Candidatus Limnocylindrales bacterium]